MRPRSTQLLAVAAFLLSLAPATLGDSSTEPAAGDLVDRIVAVVDDDPIFHSDIEQALGLGLLSQVAGESEQQQRQRALEGLIDQRLRLYEVERFEAVAAPAAMVEEQLTMIRQRFASEAQFQERMQEIGLDFATLRHLLAQQIRVLGYIEERLGPRISIDPAAVRAYYDGELAEELARQQIEQPPFAEMREPIRRLLYEKSLDDEIARWTRELRRSARIVYIDPTPSPLPIRRRLERDSKERWVTEQP